jgi:pimeloyl-ACP methyl ester carboxylesterase
VSFGTRVAMIYSYKYPQVLHRTVMIGACPPGYFLPRPEQAERILTVYDSLYQLQEGVNSKGSIREAMRKAFEKLPKRWAGFRLDADKIKAGTVMALYNRNFAVMAFDACFKAALDGDYSGLYFFQKIHEMNSNRIIGEMLSKTVSADLSDSTDFNAYSNSNNTTILGNNMTLVYQTLAAQWHIRSIPAEYRTCRSSDAETLGHL